MSDFCIIFFLFQFPIELNLLYVWLLWELSLLLIFFVIPYTAKACYYHFLQQVLHPQPLNEH